MSNGKLIGDISDIEYYLSKIEARLAKTPTRKVYNVPLNNDGSVPKHVKTLAKTLAKTNSNADVIKRYLQMIRQTLFTMNYNKVKGAKKETANDLKNDGVFLG